MPTDHQYPGSGPTIVATVGAGLPRTCGADAARTIVDATTTGTLATLDAAGYPFGSVVSYALDESGDPLFVISQLAEHTRNVAADRRASLLAAEPADGTDPLARGRVTLIGDVAAVPDAEQAAAVAIVAARVPDVAGYASYGDFACHRLQVRSIRWVGGFGEMDWIGLDDYRSASVDEVLPRRHGIIAHMNDDHADAGALLCSQATGRDVRSASMRHVDRYGCDYVGRVEGGLVLVRLAFSEPAGSADDVRRLVVELVHAARSAMS
ncbi:MAG: HugZ family protein [Ilumatobacteraceae bacterium]